MRMTKKTRTKRRTSWNRRPCRSCEFPLQSLQWWPGRGYGGECGGGEYASVHSGDSENDDDAARDGGYQYPRGESWLCVLP
jgi:hypothetical protein